MTTAETPQPELLRTFLDAGLHFGHQTKRWNPKMKQYVFSKQNGIHIIDLTKTIEQLAKARELVRDIAATGKQILFVGTKKPAQDIIKDVATRCRMPYVTSRWLGGTLTNKIGVLEANGHQNYREWKTMLAQHPAAGASWIEPRDGLFHLGSDFYERSAGILDMPRHYRDIL